MDNPSNMLNINNKFFTKCQDDLKLQGFFEINLSLPDDIKKLVKTRQFFELDQKFKLMTATDGMIFKALSEFESFNSIEFIISLRESDNEWEEDGIWHDDGSRKLAFSLSLTIEPPKGGILELRKKGDTQSTKISTPPYGNMIVFATGSNGYEHKINRVTQGSRLIIAGWCS